MRLGEFYVIVDRFLEIYYVIECDVGIIKFPFLLRNLRIILSVFNLFLFCLYILRSLKFPIGHIVYRGLINIHNQSIIQSFIHVFLFFFKNNIE